MTGILTVILHAIAQTTFNNIANVIIRPLNQKLESTGLFDLNASDVIGQYGRDLVEAARNGELQDVSGRDREIDEIISSLRQGHNPCLLGEAGVGKTALVEGFACRIARGDVPDDVKDWVIYAVDLPSLIMGKGYGGDANGGLIRLRALFEYAKKHPNVVIFIDEVHQFGSFADLCKIFLDRGLVKFIGATTFREFSVNIARDLALKRRFQQIKLDEPDAATAMKILKDRVPKLEKRYNVKVSDETIDITLALTARYLPYRPRPDRDIKVLERACETVSRKSGSNPETAGKEAEVTEADIRNSVSLECGVPVSKVTKEEMAEMLERPEKMRTVLVDQDEAIDTVCSGLDRARLELGNSGKGRYTCLLAGPTGTGKSTLAHMVSQEIGRSYVISAPQFDKDTRKELVAAIEGSPYAAITFEDIDKAKPEILSDIVSMLDTGYIINEKGLKTDFGNAVIMLTVSTGDGTMTEAEMRNYLLEKLGASTLSKVQDVVIMNQISEDAAKRIASKDLAQLVNMLSSRFGVHVEFGEDVVNSLASKGLAERQGANGIERSVSEVFNKMFSNVFKGAIAAGSEVELKEKDGEITFEVKEVKTDGKNAADAEESNAEESNAKESDAEESNAKESDAKEGAESEQNK